MARKLTTYQTSIGSYDVVVAAPSMKAAMEAWGSSSNLFHQGFAHEIDDGFVAAAALAKPGLVLKRPVDTTLPFTNHPGRRTISHPSAARRRSARQNSHSKGCQ